MITVVKGKAILQLPCGCNSRKFVVEDEEANPEKYAEDMKEVEEFVMNHSEICWSKK